MPGASVRPVGVEPSTRTGPRLVITESTFTTYGEPATGGGSRLFAAVGGSNNLSANALGVIPMSSRLAISPVAGSRFN